MFDSLKFWKRKDEPDLSTGLDDGNKQEKDNPFFQDASAFNPAAQHNDSPFSPQSFSDKSHFESAVSSKDIELLSSKLDTVKAMLENVIQRLDRLDKEKTEEKPKIETRKWY